MKKYIAMLLAVLTLTCGACGALAEALTEPAVPQEPEVEAVVLDTEVEETAAPAEEGPAEGRRPQRKIRL